MRKRFSYWKVSTMNNMNETMQFHLEETEKVSTREILMDVYEALAEKGYHPINQIVGYIMSGDPTYITSHNGARSLIMKMERDELVEEMLKSYIKNHNWE